MYLDKEILLGNNDQNIEQRLFFALGYAENFYSDCEKPQYQDEKKSKFFKKIAEAIDEGDDNLFNGIVAYLQSVVYLRINEHFRGETFVPSSYEKYLLDIEDHVKEKKYELDDYLFNRVGIESFDANTFKELLFI